MSKKLQIRPYARLITMLGDQLIKNELIALVELIKNSYDADATWVNVSFENFTDDLAITKDSKIIIEDNGCGMDQELLEKHWLNPATPEKLKRKSIQKRTIRGRILQGEKGIGRFAIFKLGKKITITTKKEDKPIENILTYDFSAYDNDFLEQDGQSKELFLDDLNVMLDSRPPKVIIPQKISIGNATKTRESYGTRIEITDLKGSWNDQKISDVQMELGKLLPIFSQNEEPDFVVQIYVNGKVHSAQEEYKEILENCMENKPVFKITNGYYNEETQTYQYELNGKPVMLSFSDPELTGMGLFRKYFMNKEYLTDCGSYRFEFSIFDFNAKADTKYYLDKQQKEIIKKHRIYLYRDEIRVMPYGDPEDDWLQIDTLRGIVRASEYFSNDQVIGCIYITQDGNPNLKDKTNREGLIESGRSLADFIKTIQLILEYLRKIEYQKYTNDKKEKQEKKDHPVENTISEIRSSIPENEEIQKLIGKMENAYRFEQTVMEDRVKKTENLAAVGLSVETSSHDLMILMGQSISTVSGMLKDYQIPDVSVDVKQLTGNLSSIYYNLVTIRDQFKDIQMMFPSTKVRTKPVNVVDIVKKVENIYSRSFLANDIHFELINPGDQPFYVKITDGVLLQIFINLFDNSLYWLKMSEKPRNIVVTMNNQEKRIIFSDNGPGIKEANRPYIFEPFFSGKGEEGRGLGLYIARQLLDRYDYIIDLAEFPSDCVLKGANFVLEFGKEG